MALRYKTRRWLSGLILLIGLPAYIVAAAILADKFDGHSTLIDLVIYAVLGLGWIVPLKYIIRGVGKEDPDNQHDK